MSIQKKFVLKSPQKLSTLEKFYTGITITIGILALLNCFLPSDGTVVPTAVLCLTSVLSIFLP